MSQKFKKLQNQNDDSTAFGKWFATAVYDQHFITTEELAEFIQTQASVKKSDIKAVFDELGAALKHFFELGARCSPEALLRTGSEGEARRHRHLQGGILEHRHEQEGGLRCAEHHHAPRAVPARDRACGRRSGEEGRQGQAEVRCCQDAHQGRGIRGDLRHRTPAGVRLRQRQRIVFRGCGGTVARGKKIL